MIRISIGRKFSCFMLTAVLSGCASNDANFSRIINEPAPVSDSDRASFGKAASLPTSALPALTFTRGDLIGTWGHKTFERMDAATRIDDPDSITNRSIGDPRNYYDAGRLLLSSVAAGTAALAEDLLSSVPKEKVEESKAAVRQALKDEPLQAGIEAQLTELAVTRHCDKLTSTPDKLLADITVSGTNRNFTALTNAGIDSVLVVRLYSQSFGIVRRQNPPVLFAADVDVFVFRTSDGSVLHYDCLEYRSRERKFTDWGANSAAHFREELKTAEKKIADMILDELFGCGG